ncbi:hypothetical protein ANCDUO_08456 [Ancylostoma duodenale]|uniref:Uncharacterized protein n=1 Tax=Ancylostoma duodenale TaxID=51022 RepID=A0A0C2CWG7_9BILA|nr:hypothetical protein ANCDUO_08456 [Ancylostoma duodenale]
MSSNQPFGVYVDEDNKVHYINCAPVKNKQRKHRPVENPVKKLINKVFHRQDSTGGQTSGSELSLNSDTKK